MKLIHKILQTLGWRSGEHPWVTYDALYSDEFIFHGSGCMFVNYSHVLAGISKQWAADMSVLDGFGGKRIGKESWKQCAFRETVEEFFGVECVPKTLLKALEEMMIPQKVLCKDNYLTLVYDFDQLVQFLRLCAKHLRKVPLYHKVPRCIEELIMGRKLSDGSEISHIVLWPLYYKHTTYEIASHFHSDIQKINHNV